MIKIVECIEQADATNITGLDPSNYLKVTNFDGTNSVTINPGDLFSSPITVPADSSIEITTKTAFTGVTIVNASSASIQSLIGEES